MSKLDPSEIDLLGLGPGADPLARNLCHIDNPDRRGARVWFVLAPYGGSILRFRGEPTSLLYAIAPLVDEIRRGCIAGYSLGDLSLLNPPVGGVPMHVEFEQRLHQQRLELLCISTLTAANAEARALAAIAKRVNPRIVVVFGGPHEDHTDSPTAGWDRNVDFSVRGDGEYALLELGRLILSRQDRSIDQLKDTLITRAGPETPLPRIDLPGRAVITFRSAAGQPRQVHCASTQGPSSSGIDLDTLPLMPRELLLEEDTRQFSVFRRYGRNLRTAQIMTHRGCYWNCTFCSESAESQPNQKVTFRSVESVKQEIEEVRRLGYEAIFFDDSTFTSRSPRRVQFLGELYEYLGRQNRAWGLEWGCQTRVDMIDLPTLREMQDAGCSYVYLGVESTSAEMLRYMHKDLPRGQERAVLGRAFDAINEVGMRVGISLIFGVASPLTNRSEETRHSVLETLDFVKRQTEHGNIVLISLNLATFYPATRMTLHGGRGIDFAEPLVHHGYPWNRYEEGEGHHPEGVDRELAEFIVRQANARFGEYLMDQDLYAIDEILLPYREGTVPLERSVYLNHAALTHPTAAARSGASHWLDRSGLVYDQARLEAAQLAGLSPTDAARVALARNTTEAASLALWISGVARRSMPSHVVVTNAENLSIHRVFRFFMDHGNPHGRDMWSTYQDFGVKLSTADLTSRRRTEYGVTAVEMAEATSDLVERIVGAMRKETSFVVLSHVVRDDGRIVDVRAVCEAVRCARTDIWILVDGAQALGALPCVPVDELGCDFYVATPHKTLGSYPLGLLYMSERARRKSVHLTEWIGDPPPFMEGMFDPSLQVGAHVGELSRPEIASFVAAIEDLRSRRFVRGADFSALDAHRASLKRTFLDELSRRCTPSFVVRDDRSYSSFITSFRFPQLDNRAIVERLWREYWTFGSYIARSDLIRFSFGADNTEREVRLAALALSKVAEEAAFYTSSSNERDPRAQVSPSSMRSSLRA